MSASTGLAFLVLLLFTRDATIAALATVTIVCIVLTDCGLIHLYGWQVTPLPLPSTRSPRAA